METPKQGSLDERWYALDVNPEPWRVPPMTAMRAKTGKPFVKAGRDNQLFYYQQALKEEFNRKYGEVEVWDGKFALSLFFWRSRPEYKSYQERTGRKHEADGTNLYKATEDALQGVLFKNDRDNVRCQWSLIDQSPTTRGQLVIMFKPVVDASLDVKYIPREVLAELEEL